MATRRAHGIDISIWQEELLPRSHNQAEIDFVILKASESTFVDPRFDVHYQSARSFSLRGAYHYFHTQSMLTSREGGPAKNQPKDAGKAGKAVVQAKNVPQFETFTVQSPGWQEQADFFISQVKDKDFHLFALDVERGPDPQSRLGKKRNIFTAADVRNIKSWIEHVQAKTGKPVLLYTNADVYKNELLRFGGQNLSSLDLWLAGYPNAPRRDEQDPLRFFEIPHFKNWRLWQYSADKNEKGAAFGVKSRDIDLDVFNGTLEDMRSWLRVIGGVAEEPVRTEEPTGQTVPGGQPLQETIVEQVKEGESFTVEVIDEKTVVQSFKQRDKAGKPIMIPHEPRIRLVKGTRFKVSATHKASDKDAGDGTVHGTGNLLYYNVTDCPANRDAEGLYVKQIDVRRV